MPDYFIKGDQCGIPTSEHWFGFSRHLVLGIRG